MPATRLPPAILSLVPLLLVACDPPAGPLGNRVGESCGRVDDCAWDLVCSAGVCTPPCASSGEDETCREELAAVLERFAGLDVDEFLKQVAPARTYLERPGFRPEAAAWFGLVDGALGLSQAQRDALARDGFVVLADRHSSDSAEAYYDIYGLDLPVLVTVDSVLDALHRSYDSLLLETETEVLAPALDELLAGIQNGLAAMIVDPARGPIDDSLDDVDVFVAVALSLLRGEPVAPVRGRNAADAAALVETAQREAPETVSLFGGPRELDFSQFRPRGHYDCEPDELGYGGPGCPGIDRYFRAMMWLGRTEFRLDAAPGEDTARQLVDAVVLQWALRNDAWPEWERLDAVISRFAGTSDNLTPRGMERLIADAAIASPADAARRVAELQALVRAKDYGVQRIASQFLHSSPIGPDGTPPPRAYLLLGQRFVADSYVFANVVFDAILWDGGRPHRLLPDPLDVAYAALGNDAAAPLLEDELRRWHYQGNLAALRALLNAHETSFWTTDVHHGWLGALRALSQDTTDPAFPRVMRTAAWARRILGEQLASWAQLRHDDMLYAKQSYSESVCSYPDAWVEPYPEVFARLGRLARDSEEAMAEVGLERVTSYFRRFGEVMNSLEAVALRVAAGEEPSAEETAFLKGVARWQEGCVPGIEGWLAEIMLTGAGGGPDDGSLNLSVFSPTIADVHTSPDTRQILHVGTGWVRWMVADFDTPAGERLFVGPVQSYYESVEGGMRRLTDGEWAARVERDELAAPWWSVAAVP
ncbi:MAG: DUF3160 domain-containing protein [Deltaproteobacteria bacterium]|nr:DUF3160 domain-containing protein [Deltaproteobacteria bacterium]